MSKPAKFFLQLCLFYSLVIYTSHAQVLSPTLNSNIDRVAVLIGLSDILSSVPAQIPSVLDQEAITLDDIEEERHIIKLLILAWDQDHIQQNIIQDLKLSFQDSETQAIIAWHQSDLAKQIRAAEDRSDNAHFYEDYIKFEAQLKQQPASPERIAAIDRFIKASAIVAFATQLNVDIQQAVLIALNHGASKRRGLSEEEIEGLSQAVRQTVEPLLKDQMQQFSLFIYKDISTADLNRYSQYYEGPHGKIEIKLTNQAIALAMKIWAQRSAAYFKQWQEHSAQHQKHRIQLP